MEKNYHLEWLDSLVSTKIISDDNYDLVDLDSIRSQISEKKEDFKVVLYSEVFKLVSHEEIEILVKQHYSLLIILYDQSINNIKKIKNRYQEGVNFIEPIVSCIIELLSFIETRFSSYLSLDEKVPDGYLFETKRMLKRKLTKVKRELYLLYQENELIEIIFKRLNRFVASKHSFYPVSFRVILYKKELVRNLEDLSKSKRISKTYSPIEELLIYLNYNSKSFVNFFTEKLVQKIKTTNNFYDKIEHLLFYFKEYKQLHRKPDIILNPYYENMDTVLSNWFSQEILFLEKKINLPISPLKERAKRIYRESEHDNEDKDKVLCILSADQMGLVLRALDELRIIKSRSMNMVFKTIVPFLSTPNKLDLSYDSMRSKSYNAEERDKEIVIESLQKVIEKIRQY